MKQTVSNSLDIREKQIRGPISKTAEGIFMKQTLGDRDASKNNWDISGKLSLDPISKTVGAIFMKHAVGDRVFQAVKNEPQRHIDGSKIN